MGVKIGEKEEIEIMEKTRVYIRIEEKREPEFSIGFPISPEEYERLLRIVREEDFASRAKRALLSFDEKEEEKEKRQREGKIALALVKAYFRKESNKEGIKIGSLGRDIGNLTQQTGVPREELRDFFKERVEELIKDAFDNAR